MVFIVTVFSIVAAVFALLAYTRRYSRRLEMIGTVAAETFVLNADEHALIAALAVKSVLSGYHGKRWLQKLERWPMNSNGVEAQARRDKVLATLNGQQSSASQSFAFKRQLEQHSSLWLDAIQKCNLEAATLIQVNAMMKEKRDANLDR